MTALQGAVESTAPVSRLHEHQSFELADFPLPSGREEEWRFTPLRRLRGRYGAAGGQGHRGNPSRTRGRCLPEPNGGIVGSAAPTCPPTGSVC
jgi:hypothetical protein